MSNPLSPQVTIPFRKGSVNCTMNLAGIFKAEQDLNVVICSPVRPGGIQFYDRPLFVQLSCYLYAALAGVDDLSPSPTIEECREVLASQKAGYVTAQLNVLVDSYQAQLGEYNKQFETAKTNGAPDPLAEEPGGPGSGLTPSSSPGSRRKSSGVGLPDK